MPSTEEVHLVEQKVLAQLDDEGDRDASLWYLDTGATNHMSGAREVFTELDTGIRGLVHFGDSSTAARGPRHHPVRGKDR